MQGKKRKESIIVFSICSLLLFLPSFIDGTIPSTNSSSYAVADSASAVRLTLLGQPTDLNPLTTSSNCRSCWQIISLEFAFGMPLRQDGSFDLQSGLFNWMTTGSNASVWDFNIRSGARWSDGQVINASDVVFSFEVRSGYFSHGLRNFLKIPVNLTSVLALNSSETEFRLVKGYSQFGALLSSQYYFPIVPEHFFQSNSSLSSSNFGQDVTDGPFFHQSYKNGSEIVLKPNPYYWNKVQSSEIDVSFASNPDSVATSLESNRTDVAQIDASSLSIFLNKPNFSITSVRDQSILYLGYDISRAPFNNTIFRQALPYALNTNAISQVVYSGYATPGVLGEGTIPPSASSWHNPNTTEYNYSPSQAETLLNNQGFKKESNGSLVFPNGTLVSFTIYTDSNLPADSKAAELVGNYLTNLGIQIHVVNESLSQLINDYSSVVSKGLVVLSSSSPVFGVSALDIRPGFEVFTPWNVTNSNWILPLSATAQFEQYTSLVNNSTDPSSIQKAVRQIDLINSQYLPVIVLAFPDDIWIYRNDRVSGLPSTISSYGLSSGGNSLDPYAFSLISTCVGTSCVAVATSKSSTSFSVSTISSSSATSSPSSSSTVTTSAPTITQTQITQNTNLAEVATIGIVIALIVVGTVLSRRNRPRPPPESPVLPKDKK